MSIFDDKRKEKKADKTVYTKDRFQVVGFAAGAPQSAGSGGAALNVQEIDGAPSVSNVTIIRVTNGTLTDDGGGQVTLTIGAAGAPADATYITQTANGSLTNEQALSTLASGLMRVANATGVVTSITDSAGLAANISDETGSGALVFGTSPTLATPRINQINDSNGNELLIFTTTASAVNELTYANAATGNNPTITASGGDSNVGLTIVSKGTGSVNLNAPIVQTSPVRTSGVTPYTRIVTPADTTLTASNEAIGIALGGTNANPPATVTRQYATGALTLHREVFIPPVTIGFVAASTLTDAVSLEVGAPIQGTNATLTRRAHFGWNGADGSAIAIHGRNVDLGSNVVISTHDSGGQVRLVLMRDRVNFFESEGQITNTFGSGTLSFGSGNVTQRVLIDAAGLVGINKASSIGAQIHTVSGATGRVGAIVDTAASPTVDIAQFRNNASATAAFAVKQDGYFTYPGIKRLTADVVVANDATVNDVTDLSVTLRSGRTYFFKFTVFSTSGAGGARFAINGTATATSIRYSVNRIDIANVNDMSMGTALDAEFTNASTNGLITTMEGTIVCNAGGTFLLGFAQSVSNAANSTLHAGGSLLIMELQ